MPFTKCQDCCFCVAHGTWNNEHWCHRFRDPKGIQQSRANDGKLSIAFYAGCGEGERRLDNREDWNFMCDFPKGSAYSENSFRGWVVSTNEQPNPGELRLTEINGAFHYWVQAEEQRHCQWVQIPETWEVVSWRPLPQAPNKGVV